MRMAPHMLLGHDPSNVRGVELREGLVRRVAGLARPYKWMLGGFLATIIVEAVIGLIPPLLIRRIVDDALNPADPDPGLVTTSALLMVVVAIAGGALTLAERWWSARIGEGLIFDLRVRLFDHVQRMPIAFFTRTQTGALISRLNNDVIGAQSALTGTLGSVVANAIQ